MRRDELMDAAERLFLRDGFETITVDTITAAAGVAKGTFYLHFQSKTAMLAALRSRFVKRFNERVRRDVDLARPQGWSAWLDAWTASVVANFFSDTELRQLVFRADGGVEASTMGQSPLVDLLAEGLEAGARERAWWISDARTTAVMVFYAVHGAVDEIVSRGETSPAERVREAVDHFVSGALRLRS